MRTTVLIPALPNLVSRADLATSLQLRTYHNMINWMCNAFSSLALAGTEFIVFYRSRPEGQIHGDCQTSEYIYA